jgi:hypothetical protein
MQVAPGVMPGVVRLVPSRWRCGACLATISMARRLPFNYQGVGSTQDLNAEALQLPNGEGWLWAKDHTRIQVIRQGGCMLHHAIMYSSYNGSLHKPGCCCVHHIRCAAWVRTKHVQCSKDSSATVGTVSARLDASECISCQCWAQGRPIQLNCFTMLSQPFPYHISHSVRLQRTTCLSAFLFRWTPRHLLSLMVQWWSSLKRSSCGP